MSGSRTLLFASIAALAGAAIYYWATERRKEQRDEGNSSSGSADVLSLPTIQLKTFFDRDKDPAAYAAECAKVADALHNYGVVVLADPRVNEADNSIFLDMMERYFELSDGVRDARPEFHFQVGVTPDHTGE